MFHEPTETEGGVPPPPPPTRFDTVPRPSRIEDIPHPRTRPSPPRSPPSPDLDTHSISQEKPPGPADQHWTPYQYPSDALLPYPSPTVVLLPYPSPTVGPLPTHTFKPDHNTPYPYPTPLLGLPAPLATLFRQRWSICRL